MGAQEDDHVSNRMLPKKSVAGSSNAFILLTHFPQRGKRKKNKKVVGGARELRMPARSIIVDAGCLLVQ